MLLWHDGQIDHLRPSDALAQEGRSEQHDVQFIAQPRRTAFRSERLCVWSFVYESEKSEVKLYLYRCSVWWAHHGMFNVFCVHWSEGFPRTRITKMSRACDCGRGHVSVGAFFFLLSSFFFLLSFFLSFFFLLSSFFFLLLSSFFFLLSPRIVP